MNVTELRSLLSRTLAAMPDHADELRKLDAALGDGDLGITVSAGSSAALDALHSLEHTADIRDVLLAVAKAFSTANPSTFAALIGGGLLAGAKTVTDKTTLNRSDVAELGEAVADRISERGKAELGDKTVLDALIPSMHTLRAHPSALTTGAANAADGLEALQALQALDAMIATAQSQIEATRALRSAKGRAAWIQDRSIGHPDPGATAYLRFLEELRNNWASA